MLGLYSNKIGNEGISRIAHALAKNRTLIATCLGPFTCQLYDSGIQ